MRKIIYYVASSIDGFISGPNDDVDGYIAEGSGLAQYLSDLKTYDTVIMGRATYEYGYNFGIKPGQAPYPDMEHYIFSNNLIFENPHPTVHIRKINLEAITAIRQQASTDIYLCGGGQFAGWLLDHGQIDTVKIKLSPLVMGQGTRIFGASSRKYKAKLIDTEKHDQGLQIMTFSINY